MIKLILRLAYIALTFIEGLIVANIVLVIANANRNNSIVSWIINTSEIFIAPFEGVLTSDIKINDFVISVTPFVALVFFLIAGFILSELLKSFSRD